MRKVQHWLAAMMTTSGALGMWAMGCTVEAHGPDLVCTLDDDPCDFDEECCSNYCASDGYCGLPGGGGVCGGDGDTCDYDDDCCGGFCASDGACGCISDDDPCNFDDDCCGGFCASDGYCG